MRRREFIRMAGVTALGAYLWREAARFSLAAPREKFKLGIILDEVTDDLNKALPFFKEFKLEWVEVRNLWGKYVTEQTISAVKRAREILDQNNIKVSVMATAFYKCTLPGTTPQIAGERDAFQQELYPYEKQEALLDRAIERAKILGTKYLRIFSFWRVSDPRTVFDRVAKQLEKVAEKAKSAGMVVLLENENTTNVATGREAAEMLRAVKSDGLAMVWDPGNAYAASETPYPDGYSHLDKKRIIHLHLKDGVLDPENKRVTWLPIGKGKIDFVGQLRALLKDGYQGTLSLETHYRHPSGDKVLSSRESMQGLLETIKKA